MTPIQTTTGEIRDLASESHISDLLGLLQRVSQATNPWEIQQEFGSSMRTRTQADAYVSLSLRDLPQEDPQPYRLTRLQVGDAVGQLTRTPWEHAERLPVARGGFLGKIIATPTPKIAHHLDLRSDPILGDSLAEMGSCIAIPLFDAGQPLNWGITFRRNPIAATVEEADEFLLRGNLIGGLTRALVVSNQVRQLNARLTSQLEHIAQIQRSLLPNELPHIEGLNLAASYLTSNEAGGDYYDFFEMGDNRWGAIIADVSGHGAGAATVMAMLQAILHAYQERHLGPGPMLEHANRQLLVRRVESNFVTAFMGIFDANRRLFTWANAGHNRPIRHFAAGGVEPIDGETSVPLGILDDAQYPHNTLPLELGQTVVLYTDGITEAFSPSPNREMFGTHRLIRSLEECSGYPECVIDSIHERLYEHTHARTREDDQTIVAIRVEN